MKSQGTKETQGINGDAAMLQRKLAAAATATSGDGAPCPYANHRGSDWRLSDEHPLVCGICHPPSVTAGARQEVTAHAA